MSLEIRNNENNFIQASYELDCANYELEILQSKVPSLAKVYNFAAFYIQRAYLNLFNCCLGKAGQANWIDKKISQLYQNFTQTLGGKMQTGKAYQTSMSVFRNLMGSYNLIGRSTSGKKEEINTNLSDMRRCFEEKELNNILFETRKLSTRNKDDAFELFMTKITPLSEDSKKRACKDLVEFHSYILDEDKLEVLEKIYGKEELKKLIEFALSDDKLLKISQGMLLEDLLNDKLEDGIDTFEDWLKTALKDITLNNKNKWIKELTEEFEKIAQETVGYKKFSFIFNEAIKIIEVKSRSTKKIINKTFQNYLMLKAERYLKGEYENYTELDDLAEDAQFDQEFDGENFGDDF